MSIKGFKGLKTDGVSTISLWTVCPTVKLRKTIKTEHKSTELTVDIMNKIGKIEPYLEGESPDEVEFESRGEGWIMYHIDGHGIMVTDGTRHCIDCVLDYKLQRDPLDTKRRYMRYLKKYSPRYYQVYLRELQRSSEAIDWPDNLSRKEAISELKKRVEMIEDLRIHRDALLNALAHYKFQEELEEMLGF